MRDFTQTEEDFHALPLFRKRLMRGVAQPEPSTSQTVLRHLVPDLVARDAEQSCCRRLIAARAAKRLPDQVFLDLGQVTPLLP